jgi:RluA family pseudouridine synthase
MSGFTNISTYQFAPLRELKPLRETLIDRCKEWQLKGTILLSTEGINLFVAGKAAQIQSLLELLRQVPGLEDLTPKISESDEQPFTRMLVRIKKEIIAFGVPGIDPSKRTSPKLPAKQLKQWLDQVKPITLLDTRNDYEIKLGTFDRALPIGIKHFRDFPKAVGNLPEALKNQPIVMFCTGGIRCEKAGPYMESQGFNQIYQLDGGILKYFEECGSAHYQGDCFVFDQRVGVDAHLHETPNAQCFVCLTPLTAEDQQSEKYKVGESCPYCFKTTEERMQLTIAERHEAIRKVTTPLPGSAPYKNLRPVKVPAKYDRLTLLAFLCKILSHIPEQEWQRDLDAGRFTDTLGKVVGADKIVHSGERYYHVTANESEPDVNPAVRILYEDQALIVLEKPAPLPIHPCGRYNRNTLQYILEKVYAPQKPHAAHRLDANTTGLLLVSRTRHFAGLLQPQFADGRVQKTYRALVYGAPQEDEFICDLPLSEKTMVAGAREAHVDGLPARTELTVLERRANGTSLLEVRPITGRTNQIRIHLWELGFPIVGELLYLPGRKLGDTQTAATEDPPLCLHAKSLSFVHPLTGLRMHFESQQDSSPIQPLLSATDFAAATPIHVL